MKKIDISETEMFALSDKVILTETYESVLGYGGKIGAEYDRLFYMFTFSGRLNNKDRSSDVTLLMSPEDAFALASDILDGITMLMYRQEGSDGED